jgi:hypothetical protein
LLSLTLVKLSTKVTTEISVGFQLTFEIYGDLGGGRSRYVVVAGLDYFIEKIFFITETHGK